MKEKLIDVLNKLKREINANSKYSINIINKYAKIYIGVIYDNNLKAVYTTVPYFSEEMALANAIVIYEKDYKNK